MNAQSLILFLSLASLFSCKSLDGKRRSQMETGLIMEQPVMEAQQKEGMAAPSEPTVLNLTEVSNAKATESTTVRSCTLDEVCFQTVDADAGIFFCAGVASKKECERKQYKNTCLSTQTYASGPQAGDSSNRSEKLAFFFKGESELIARCDKNSIKAL